MANDSMFRYIVFSYRYNTMARAKVDAIRRTFHDARDLDSMPPTVIKWANVAAVNKREAIHAGRPIVSA